MIGSAEVCATLRSRGGRKRCLVQPRLAEVEARATGDTAPGDGAGGDDTAAGVFVRRTAGTNGPALGI
jgi:hypothetical protein